MSSSTGGCLHTVVECLENMKKKTFDLEQKDEENEFERCHVEDSIYVEQWEEWRFSVMNFLFGCLMVWPLVRFAGASIASTFDLANNTFCAISQPERECNENEWGTEWGTKVVKILRKNLHLNWRCLRSPPTTLPSTIPFFCLNHPYKVRRRWNTITFVVIFSGEFIYMWARHSFCDIEIKLERKKYISNCFRNKWFDSLLLLLLAGWCVSDSSEWI